MQHSPSVLNVIRQDQNIVIYRPEFRQIAGSVTASILLQQIIYRCGDKGEFYKFKEPCKHKLSRGGDSWCEELEFSSEEFDTTLKKISTKVNKDSDLSNITTPVYYWTTIDRVTYYALNLAV